jgi:acyl carrier protein
MSNDQSDELLSAISEVFAPTHVTPDSTLDELEATSLHLLRLMSSLQHKYNIALDVVDMFTVENVDDLIRLVEERVAAGGLAPR